jgi:hypothetical protein
METKSTSGVPTPRPWQIKGNGVYGPNGDWVLTFNATARGRANAELIVRAVNSHDALVAALERCIITLNSAMDKDFPLNLTWDDAVGMARAALKLAKGTE